MAFLPLAAPLARAQYDKDVFSFRGRNALSEGKWAEAITQFNVLARLDTTDYWTFFYRGIAKYNLGDIRGSQRDFDTAIRLNPVFTPAIITGPLRRTVSAVTMRPWRTWRRRFRSGRA